MMFRPQPVGWSDVPFPSAFAHKPCLKEVDASIEPKEVNHANSRTEADTAIQ